MRLGIHMPLKKGFAYNAQRLKEIGGETVQVFPGNPSSWKPPSISEEEIRERSKVLEQLEIYPLVIHTAYLINLASANEDTYEKSVKLLRETLFQAELYGAPYVVLHTGSHGGKGPEKGINKIIEALKGELSSWPNEVTLLLENTAGGGNSLGGDIKYMGKIMRNLPEVPLGLCLDTAHAWGAGYDMASEKGVDQLLKEVEYEMGINRLKLIHANDTNVEMGSSRDRHHHIGEGKIGMTGFTALFNKVWSLDLPVILETPDMGTDKDKQNLETLRSCLP